jgi:acyl carrier protein
MKKQEFLTEIEKITMSDPGTLTPETSLDDLPGWDSMAVLAYIALADEKMKKRIPTDKINNCKKVEDLYNLIINI